MKKFILTILLLIFLSLNFSLISFCENHENKLEIPVIYVDEKLVKFESNPYFKNNVTMVPMKEFFNSLGCDVEWINSSQEVIAYKNNMFVKLKINENIAYKNGKKFILSSPPVIENEKTYVPMDFVAETFDMVVNYDEESNSISIDSENSENKYLVVEGSFFKKTNLDNLGISISIPTFWLKLDGKESLYGYNDEFEFYSIKVSKEGIEPETSLEEFAESKKSELFETFGDKIIFNGSDFLATDNFDLLISFITTIVNGIPQNQILYFAVAEDNGYIFTCNYGNYALEEDAIDLFNNIMNTFQINNLTLNSNEEHYFEYRSFFDYGFSLENEFYSNMSSESYIDFYGTIEKEHDFSKLKASVFKDNMKLEFPVKIDKNHFNGKIYLPFGLGKHNITITAIENETGKALNLMRFSVINISNEKIRYIIPTDFIESNSENIYNEAYSITYRSNSDYLKTRAIFSWLVSNMKIYENETLPLSSEEIMKYKIGNEEEISILYCTLLRSLEIPSKIVRGYSEEKTRIWTEVLINGKWIVSNPFEQIKYNNSFDENIVNFDFFSMPNDTYYEDFDTIEILPY